MKDVIHFYPARDLKNIRHVYQDLLGLTLYKDQGKCLIYDMDGNGKIGFCTHHPKNPPSSTCVTLVYGTKEEVDRVFGNLKADLEVITPPGENPDFGIYHAFLRDPEGIEIELQVFLG